MAPLFGAPWNRSARSRSTPLGTSVARTVARPAAAGAPSNARARATSTTVTVPGTRRTRRRTVATACTDEHAQATSSAPFAAAIPAARATPARSLASIPAVGTETASGVSAASAARSAAVCAAALPLARAPTSTATTPARSTKPVRAKLTRVAPPRSSTGEAPSVTSVIGATRLRRRQRGPASAGCRVGTRVVLEASSVCRAWRWSGFTGGDRGGAGHDRGNAEGQAHRQLHRHPDAVRSRGGDPDPGRPSEWQRGTCGRRGSGLITADRGLPGRLAGCPLREDLVARAR